MTRNQNPENVGVKATLLATSSLVPLGTVALAPALPAISAEFQDIANAALWTSLILSLPALFIAAASPFAGYIVDNAGRKNVLIASVLLVGLAGLSGLLAPSIGILLAGRALIGIGVAGLMISTTTLIADYYVGDERSNLIGLQAAFMGIAGTALLLVVGVLAAIGWRTPFLIYLLPFVVLPFDLFLLFEPRHEERCADNPPPLGEPGSCIGESITDGGRVPAGLAPAEPIPVKLIAFIYATIFLSQLIFYIVPIQLPFYLQELTGATAAQSGLAMAVMSLAYAITSMFYGRVAARLDHITILLVSLVLIGVSYGFLSQAGNTVALYIGLIGSGAGLGLLVPNLYVWLANEAPLAVRGTVLGGFTTALFLGQFLSPLVSGPVTVSFDAQVTFLLAGVLLLALVPFLFATRNRLRLMTA